MTQGIVIDDEGNKADGVLRSNGLVTFTIGRTTRHISLSDFAELGMVWKAVGPDQQVSAAPYRDPVDAPRYFRTTGEGL